MLDRFGSLEINSTYPVLGGEGHFEPEIATHFSKYVRYEHPSARKCPKLVHFQPLWLLTLRPHRHNVRCNAVEESLVMTSLVVIVGTKRMGR